MPEFNEKLLGNLTVPFYFGQILIKRSDGDGFVVLHRDDELLNQFDTFRDAEAAIEIAKYDDAGDYRPLKTAPNLRHGWLLQLATVEQLERALNHFYPGGSRFSRRGKPDGLKRRLCATHWIANRGCTALPQKFPMRRSMMSSRVFVDPMAAA